MGDGRAQAAGPGRLRAFRLGLSALRRRAGLPRGNRTARARPAGTRRLAIAAVGGTEIATQKGLIPALETLDWPAMSSPQPSALSPFSATDHAHMARALRLAERGLYTTQPNPRVGCVIAQAESIVGEGWHERAGEPHAEVFALREAGTRARGATAYVTLEPCSHFGRTPPCADALIAAGVARVVAASDD